MLLGIIIYLKKAFGPHSFPGLCLQPRKSFLSKGKKKKKNVPLEIHLGVYFGSFGRIFCMEDSAFIARH